MVALQDAWSKIGVTCNVSVIDSGVWSDARTNGDLEVTLVTWSTLSFQGVEHMGSYFRSDRAAKKSSFYNNPEFDKLLVEGRSESNKDKRTEDYKDADNLLTRTDFATLPLYWPKNSFVAKKYVKNAKVGNLIYHFFDVDIDTSNSDYTVPED